jgi:inorganic pyrophosphatase
VTAPVRQFAANPSSPVDTVKCLVEIPKGSRSKYDYDPELGAIKLDASCPPPSSIRPTMGLFPRRCRPMGTHSMR